MHGITHGFSFRPLSCDAMYHMQECKSKLELFYLLFMELSLSCLVIKTRLNGVWYKKQ